MQNCTEKQIMPSKTTINWLFNDVCYLFIACFDWKISVFQQAVVSIYYILKKLFTSSVHSWDTVNFRVLWPDDHSHPKKIWSTFNLSEFVSTCKKSGYFIDLFWRYGWLKNPAIWLAENILAHISGIFPSMGFVQEQSK